MVQYRTSRLLQTAAARLQKHTKTLGTFGAWNRCLNHVLTLAESHIESVILEKFIEAVKKYLPTYLLIFSNFFFPSLIIDTNLSFFLYYATTDVLMKVLKLL